VVYSAICYHSIEEIHYLKTFCPGKFTVQEAFFASGVELVKIIIIGILVILVIAVCFMAANNNKERGDRQ
jgi:hypothetical protein